MGAATWVVGAAINVVGSILINLGTNVMKLGHNKRLAKPVNERPLVRNVREWQLGVLFFAVGNVMNFVSLGFAAQSILAALGSVQFVSNVVFAWFVLQEQATRRVCAATGCIVLGCIILITFGNHQSTTLTVQDMLQYYESPVYISYLATMGVMVVAMLLVYRRGSQKLAQEGREALAGSWMAVLPVSYALFSGLLGTQSVVFCKSLSSLLRTTLAGDSQLMSAFFWILLALFLATATFWVTRLNKLLIPKAMQGLREFPSSVIVPMMQISWTMFSILSGGIYFHEYRVFTAFTGTMFAVGVAVVCVGVFLLTPTKKAYLRYYQDLEADLMGPHEGPELLEVDTESLLRMPQEPVPGVAPSAAGLQTTAGHHAQTLPPGSLWGASGEWAKELGLTKLSGGISHPSRGVSHGARESLPEDQLPIPEARVTVSVEPSGPKELAARLSASSQTSLGLARLRTTSVDPGAAAELSHAAKKAPGGALSAADKAADAAAGWVTFGEPLTPVPPLAGSSVPGLQPHYS